LKTSNGWVSEYRKVVFAGIVIVCCHTNSYANPEIYTEQVSELDTDLNNAQDSEHSDQNGGFLELGLELTLARGVLQRLDPKENGEYAADFELGISAGYRYNRFFIEARDSTFDGLNAGITAFRNHHWTVDALVANVNGRHTVRSAEAPDVTDNPITEDERNRSIIARDTLFAAGGVRVRRFSGDGIADIKVVTDWYGGHGITGSARLGQQWQLGNVNVQATGGFRYNSEEFNNFLFGVSEEEQSVRFPAYRADAAWIPEVQVELRKPLKKNWVMASTFLYRYYPDAISDSPIVAKDEDFLISSGLYYVF